MKHQTQIFFTSIKKQCLMSVLMIGGIFSIADINGMPMPKGGMPPAGMPSVADVFGNLSEQEIAEQVKMGQQFLEDLQKNGSPEEREAFEKLLMETLNSMSEQDFKDIQDIATMVEPHIQTPTPAQEPQITPSTPIEVKPAPAVVTASTTSSVLDDFKQLISTISQRIDDIMQKIDSSKECAEQADVLWKNRTTFSNMKRQIYQLRNDRLASKLTKDDLEGNDKKLVEKLHKFLKGLTHHNDAFVIQDDFGVPTSYKEEKKHLKQTKEILSVFDEYIDNLMPLLEKFLRSWDPEALQMAKESEDRGNKASKDALDATARKPSPDAPRSIGGGSSYGQTSSYSNPAYYDNYSGQGNYQDYGSGYPQSSYPQSSGSDFGSTGSKSKGTGTAASATPATELKKDLPTAEKPKRSSIYENVMGDLNDHIEDLFPSKHVDEFLTFMKKDMVDGYQDLSLDTPNNEGTKPYKMPGMGKAWINTTFIPYVENVNSQLNNKFYPELDDIKELLQNTKSGIEEMTAKELSQLQNAKELDIIERRLNDYHTAFKTSEAAIEQKFKNNSAPAPVPEADNIVSPTTDIFLDPGELRDYTAAHNSFIRGLKLNMETKIAELQNLIRSTKKRAKSRAEKASKEEPVKASKS